MKIISHRGLWNKNNPQNSLRAFAASQGFGCGIETDLRSFQGALWLSHDPIRNSEGLTSFDALLELWESSKDLPLFLNIKEDGLIPLLLPYRSKLSKLRPVFFDMSIPQLVQFAKVFPKSMLATRFSEWEQPPHAIELCDWVWADGFRLDPSLEILQSFVVEKKLSLAIVSPELHQRDPALAWAQFKQSFFLKHPNIYLCTDRVAEALQENL